MCFFPPPWCYFLPRKEIISESLFIASYCLLEFCSHADEHETKRSHIIGQEKQHTKVAAVPRDMMHTADSLWPSESLWMAMPFTALFKLKT